MVGAVDMIPHYRLSRPLLVIQFWATGFENIIGHQKGIFEKSGKDGEDTSHTF